MRLIAIACIFSIVLIVIAGMGVPYVLGVNFNSNVDRSLAIAGLIVAGATLASVMFAVITYLESVILSDRIVSVAEDYESFREKSEAALHAMNDTFKERLYSLSLMSFQGLYDFALQLPEEQTFNDVMRSVRVAEVNVHLARGSYMSAFRGIQMATKEGPKSLLRIEGRIHEIADSLPQQEREQLISSFKDLKESALAKLR